MRIKGEITTIVRHYFYSFNRFSLLPFFFPPFPFPRFSFLCTITAVETRLQWVFFFFFFFFPLNLLFSFQSPFDFFSLFIPPPFSKFQRETQTEIIISRIVLQETRGGKKERDSRRNSSRGYYAR